MKIEEVNLKGAYLSMLNRFCSKFMAHQYGVISAKHYPWQLRGSEIWHGANLNIIGLAKYIMWPIRITPTN